MNGNLSRLLMLGDLLELLLGNPGQGGVQTGMNMNKKNGNGNAEHEQVNASASATAAVLKLAKDQWGCCALKACLDVFGDIEGRQLEMVTGVGGDNLQLSGAQMRLNRIELNRLTRVDRHLQRTLAAECLDLGRAEYGNYVIQHLFREDAPVAKKNVDSIEGGQGNKKAMRTGGDRGGESGNIFSDAGDLLRSMVREH